MSFTRRDDRGYIMPITFGPNSIMYPETGKSITNFSEIHVASITYESDRDAIKHFCRNVTLSDPYVTVAVCEFTNTGYMAGKAYNLINVNVPVHFKGERDDLDADYIMVMFENHGDPIMGGRDTMGYNKVYCEIEHQTLRQQIRCQSQQLGFPLHEDGTGYVQRSSRSENFAGERSKKPGQGELQISATRNGKGEEPALNYETSSSINDPAEVGAAG